MYKISLGQNTIYSGRFKPKRDWKSKKNSDNLWEAKNSVQIDKRKINDRRYDTDSS